MKRGIHILVFMLAIVLCAGFIVEAGYPVKVKDDMGKVTVIARKPMRIVSLAPSHTEVLFALGLGNRVVGRTDFCDYPAEVSKVPSLGGYSQPSIESILAVKPDLIFASFGTPKEIVEQLRKLGIPVVGYNPETLSDITRLIWEMGKITDTEGTAVRLVQNMKDRIAAVQKVVQNAPRPTVFWEVWHDPIYTAGHNTYINDLINLAGGVNIAADTKGWPVYSLEMLLAKNPDVYFATKDQWSSPGNIPGRAGYNQLKAVKNNRVYIIDANTVNRPSLRLVEGLETVARLLHPDLFKK